MKIKVCGMREAQNIAEVAQIAPDFMGFVFYKHSRRYAGGMAPEALAVLSPDTRRVGVFVNELRERVVATALRYGLDFVQLHGAETPDMCAGLRSEGLGVIKAFGVAAAADVARAADFEGSCDLYLFDTAGTGHGGTGRKFDHSLLEAYTGLTPYLLSGGLGPDDACALARPANPLCMGFDINSRFETAPGIKNPEAIKTFIEIIKKSIQ